MITPLVTAGQLINSSTGQLVYDSSTYGIGDRATVGVFLFAKLTISSIDYPLGYLPGDKLNPQTDTYWTVPIYSNGVFTYYLKIIVFYAAGTTYSSGDWVYDTASKKLYVSLAGSNIGHGFDTAWWREYTDSDFTTIIAKTSNGVANTFYSNSTTSSVSSSIAPKVKINLTKCNAESICGSPSFEDITGNYNAYSNPYGYGGPNKIRAEIPFALFYINNKTTGTVVYPMDTYNALTDTTFTVTLSKDGVFKLTLFTPPIFDDTNTFTQGQTVYSDINEAFYVAVVALGTGSDIDNINQWRPATYYDFIADTTCTVFYFDSIENCKMEQYLTTIGNNQLYVPIHDNDLEFKLWVKLYQYYQTSKIAFCNKQLLIAQKAIEDFQDNMIPTTNLPALE